MFNPNDVGALEVPEGWAGVRAPEFVVVPHPTLSICALKVRRVDGSDWGIAIWHVETGKLKPYFPWASHFHWLRGGTQAATMEFAHGRKLFRQWEVEGWRQHGELVVPVADGGCDIEQVRTSKSGEWIATHRHSGQGEWGYDVIRVAPLSRAGGIESKRGFLAGAPEFDDAESRVVGGYGMSWNGGWWSHPDDNGDEPARGGHLTFGWIFVHRLPGHEVSWHELKMHVPQGYLPKDPYAEAWAGPSDIVPLGEGFRMTLPGGVPFAIETTLPPVIELPLP